jgi:hypothetical protein
MIVFVPDPISSPSPALKFGLLATLSFPVSKRAELLMIDIGKRAAQIGVSIHDYYKFAWRTATRTGAAEVRVVFPDAFCDPRRTRELFYQFLRITGRHDWLKIYVAHNFWETYDPPPETDIIALPARQQCFTSFTSFTSCSKSYETCATRIINFLASRVEDRPIHLLGPALRTLRLVLASRQPFGSFDTMAYRRAVDYELKEVQGGKWNVGKGREALFLTRWLEKAGLLTAR